MAKYKEYRIAVDNNVINLKLSDAGELIETTPKTTAAVPKKDSVSKLIAVEAGRRSANYAIKNYGNLTGDEIGQQQLSETINMIGMAALAFSSPVGAFAVGAKITGDLVDRAINVNKSRRASRTMQTRLGINHGGSRYGSRN